MAKETYYFSHDANARNDERILMLRAEHGFEGYGIYWALVEMMFEAEDTALNHDKLKGIAFSYNVDITKLNSVITTCISEELFCSDGEMFWSESLRRRKDKYLSTKAAKSAAGKKGMEKRWSHKEEDNTVITELYQSNNVDITENNKVNESKGKKRKNKLKDTPYEEIGHMTLYNGEFKKLVDDFGEFAVRRKIEALRNWPKIEQCKDANATLRNWLNRDFDKNQAANITAVRKVADF